jgi:YD repeat-containing protein
VGGSTSEHTTVTFTFDPSGRLLQTTATQGADKRNIGLFNGQRQ